MLLDHGANIHDDDVSSTRSATIFTRSTEGPPIAIISS